MSKRVEGYKRQATDMAKKKRHTLGDWKSDDGRLKAYCITPICQVWASIPASRKGKGGIQGTAVDENGLGCPVRMPSTSRGW